MRRAPLHATSRARPRRTELLVAAGGYPYLRNKYRVAPSHQGASVFLYIGPEVLMPLASIAAAMGGIVLMFWRRFTGIARAGLSTFSARVLGRPVLEAQAPADSTSE